MAEKKRSPRRRKPPIIRRDEYEKADAKAEATDILKAMLSDRRIRDGLSKGELEALEAHALGSTYRGAAEKLNKSKSEVGRLLDSAVAKIRTRIKAAQASGQPTFESLQERYDELLIEDN